MRVLVKQKARLGSVFCAKQRDRLQQETSRKERHVSLFSLDFFPLEVCSRLLVLFSLLLRATFSFSFTMRAANEC